MPLFGGVFLFPVFLDLINEHLCKFNFVVIHVLNGIYKAFHYITFIFLDFLRLFIFKTKQVADCHTEISRDANKQIL